MTKVAALVLAGGKSINMPVLTSTRSVAALPFAGRYRVIDFVLSNCRFSEIYDVGILAQYNPTSLVRHIGDGSPWDLARTSGGVAILQPYRARRTSTWYRGTADALAQNIDFIRQRKAEIVLVLSGDQVYIADYLPLLEFHRNSGMPVTVAMVDATNLNPRRYGFIEIDDSGKVGKIIEKPPDHRTPYISMGVYVFDKDVLLDCLGSLGEGHYDIVFDVIEPLVLEGKVGACLHRGYWADVGWLDEYYRASMLCLGQSGVLSQATASRIMSRYRSAPPAYISTKAKIEDSLISGGSIIEGDVYRSIVFPGVRIRCGSKVQDSILFDGVSIGENASIRSAILDKQVTVGANSSIGFGAPTHPNSMHPEVASFGVTVIGKLTSLPSGIRIGRNCLIGPHLGEEDLPRRDIECGETILKERQWVSISQLS